MTRAGFVIGTVALLALAGNAAAADLPVKAPPPAILTAYDWSGFYAGDHIGYAWGTSHWSTPGNTGALSLSQPLDVFAETGSFFEGLHAGYNYMLPNRIVVGVEADTTFPAFRNLNGLSIGGSTTFFSPVVGALETYGETMLAFGTMRGRMAHVVRPLEGSNVPGGWRLSGRDRRRADRGSVLSGLPSRFDHDLRSVAKCFLGRDGGH